MIRPVHGFCAAAVLGASVWMIAAQPAGAATMKECSAMYKSAQQAGTLNGMKFKEFRKEKCGAQAVSAPAAAPAAARSKETAAPARRAETPRAAVGNAVFPTAVSPKYSKESAGKARMHTCLDQYNQNKTAGGTGNGGLKWIAKGDGYYSECNKRLKG